MLMLVSVFNGPAAANYDIDLGPLILGDWWYQGAFAEEDIQDQSLNDLEIGPSPDTSLINGTNGLHSGSYQDGIITFTPGKSHRLRIVNTALSTPFIFSVDQHQLQVITSDFVPIEPIWTDSVVIAIGQRYDIIVQANQSIDNYWVRAEPSNECSALPNTPPAQAIVHYEGAPNSSPTVNTPAPDPGCVEPGSLIPVVPNNVGSVEDFKSQVRDLDVNYYAPGTTTNKQNLVFWGINATAIDVQWDDPILEYVETGNTSYPVVENLIELPNQNVWTYWIIQEVPNAPGAPEQPWHPIHLHGHDFYVLGTGNGTFDVDTDADTLTYENPTRRDTANLPVNGWLVIAFETDNPGACMSTLLSHLFQANSGR